MWLSSTSKMHLSSPVTHAAVRSKAVVLLLLIYFFIVAPLFCGGSVVGPRFVIPYFMSF